MTVASGTEERDVALWRAELDEVRRIYAASHAKHGDSLGALRWGSSRTQMLRFDVLCEIAKGEFDSCSLLDVGSGLGDLLHRLGERGFSGTYRGIDPMPQFVSAARARFPSGDFAVSSVYELDTVEPADFVVASGIFTFARHDPLAHVRYAARQMLARARCGVAFNCLSSWGPAPELGEYQFNPGEVLAAMRGLAPRVRLRHDYLPHDFTVYLWTRQ